MSVFVLLPVRHSRVLLLRRFHSRSKPDSQKSPARAFESKQTRDFASWKFSAHHPGRRIPPPTKTSDNLTHRYFSAYLNCIPRIKPSPRALLSACIWVGLLVASQPSLLLVLPKPTSPSSLIPLEISGSLVAFFINRSSPQKCPHLHRLPWPAGSSALVPPLPRHRRSFTPAISVNPQRRQRYQRTHPHPLTKPTSLAS